jgi:transcription termination factor NusB
MFNPKADPELVKHAQMLEDNAVYVAEELYNVIKIMINKMNPGSRAKSFNNIKGKISGFNVMEISNKKSPGGAAIGASLGLIKNVLNSKDPYFINVVLSELSSRL